MPVTPEQGRMLATLAVACRPYNAPRWDEAGTLAAIKRIATWNLAVVIDNVIKHASDPRAVSPGVIGGNYTPPDVVKPSATPPKKHEQCARCGGLKGGCACAREHLAATYDDDQETTRMDAETARKAARDAIHAAKGGCEFAVIEEEV
jgi:hypothetical protein